MTRTATCHCGRLALRCDGEPVVVSICHCLECQRRTGSAFGIGAFFPRDRVTVTAGTATPFTRAGDSGATITAHFCPICGTTLWWEPERAPAMVGVAVGAFADPDFPAPTQATWDERRHPWVHLPDTITAHRLGVVRPPSGGA